MIENPWATKMENFTVFSDMEKCRLDGLISENQEYHAPKKDFVLEGSNPDYCHVIISGLACRYKMLPNGDRQIVAFLIPGDLCDAEVFIVREMDHSIAAITPTTTAVISAEVMKLLLREASSFGEALWWGTLTDLSVLRERIVDEGRRSAYVRIAHFFYEMLVRYRMVNLTKGDSFDFPITQVDLADAIGITPVHTNRMLQKLKSDGVIKFIDGLVTVISVNRLKDVAQFSGAYLHLDRVHNGTDAGCRARDLV